MRDALDAMAQEGRSGREEWERRVARKAHRRPTRYCGGRGLRGRKNEALGRRPEEEWLSGPNEQGRCKEIEDTIDERKTFGIALARALHAKGKWDHPGWPAICNALGPKESEQAVRVALGEDFWTKVMEGEQGWCVGELVSKGASPLRLTPSRLRGPAPSRPARGPDRRP